ncbi:BTB/POZ domain protein [Cooperia oncophora]
MSQVSSVGSETADEGYGLSGIPPNKISTSGCVTRFDTVDLHYAWVIEDFSAQMDLHSIGEHLTSKNFGDNDHEFVLKLFPAGKDEDCTGYISLYLQIIRCPNPKIQLRIRFSVETPDGPRECSLNKSVLSINRGGIITASKFFHSDIVKNRFLRRGLRDALTVSADITVFLDSKTTTEAPFRDYDEDEFVMSNCYDLPVSECNATVPSSEVLREMLKSGRFSDFIIDVDNFEFPLHRCVLAATSQYFSAMLKDQTLETSNGRVELKDISADVFAIIVDYIYEVKRPQSEDITMELIKAVDMLMMDGMKAHCCAVLMRDITVENFALRLQIAEFLNDDRLFKRLVAFLATNRREVFAHEDWVSLRNVHPKMVCRVMEAAWAYAEGQFPYIKFIKRRRFCL